MTLADAIIRARAGESDGFACLFENTIPHVWLAAAMLGCPQCGTTVTQIYRNAQQLVSSLRSPSDLRVWIGQISYDVLLKQPENIGRDIRSLTGIMQDVYSMMKGLPTEERVALLLMCGEGCSAPQAADILSVPDIEVKRAMRRARQTIAEQMKQRDAEQNCNTAWLIARLADLRSAQSEADAAVQGQILRCVQTGEDYIEPVQEEAELPVQEEIEETPIKEEKPEEKGGFFQKLFRSRRFG
ncbi:MAG: hypothetical protein LUE11_06610 [Clostridia bacterium]|nr:hypothetical protein [Clostridia bacterium]